MHDDLVTFTVPFLLIIYYVRRYTYYGAVIR